MVSKVYYTPQIGLPSSLNIEDCIPFKVMSDEDLAVAYLVNGYANRSAWKAFNKGPIPPPISISSEFLDGKTTYSIYFNAFEGGNCPAMTCDLSCMTHSVALSTGGVTVSDISYCINGERPAYFFDVNYTGEGDRYGIPAQFNFTFTDSNNNESLVSISSISQIKPLKPNVGIVTEDGVSTAYVGPIFKTVNYVDIGSDDITDFKIERLEQLKKTASYTTVSWTKIEATSPKVHDNLFEDKIDYDRPYYYRVKFKNKYGEESQWSDYAGVNTGYYNFTGGSFGS